MPGRVILPGPTPPPLPCSHRCTDPPSSGTLIVAPLLPDLREVGTNLDVNFDVQKNLDSLAVA